MNEVMDYEASADEAAAYKQVALDLLYNLGCQYDIKTTDMQHLCELACIPFADLQKYSGVQSTH